MELKLQEVHLPYDIYFLRTTIFFFVTLPFRVVSDTLEDYSFMSGQLVNLDKSAAYFSKGTCRLR